MGQKIHPTGFRLSISRNWASRWYANDRDFAGMLADRLHEVVAAAPRAQLVLPVPLSTPRLAERGYNQAWELTRSLQGQSSCAAIADSALLLRTRHTRPQSELKRSERHDNVKGAFALEPLRATHVAGRRVMLVDDVMTSGASLLAAATALRQAGAAEVSAIVLARTAPT